MIFASKAAATRRSSFLSRARVAFPITRSRLSPATVMTQPGSTARSLAFRDLGGVVIQGASPAHTSSMGTTCA